MHVMCKLRVPFPVHVEKEMDQPELNLKPFQCGSVCALQGDHWIHNKRFVACRSSQMPAQCNTNSNNIFKEVVRFVVTSFVLSVELNRADWLLS